MFISFSLTKNNCPYFPVWIQEESVTVVVIRGWNSVLDWKLENIKLLSTVAQIAAGILNIRRASYSSPKYLQSLLPSTLRFTYIWKRNLLKVRLIICVDFFSLQLWLVVLWLKLLQCRSHCKPLWVKVVYVKAFRQNKLSHFKSAERIFLEAHGIVISRLSLQRS